MKLVINLQYKVLFLYVETKNQLPCIHKRRHRYELCILYYKRCHVSSRINLRIHLLPQSIPSHRHHSLVGRVLVIVQSPGQSSKRNTKSNMKKKYFFTDFLSEDFEQENKSLQEKKTPWKVSQKSVIWRPLSNVGSVTHV